MTEIFQNWWKTWILWIRKFKQDKEREISPKYIGKYKIVIVARERKQTVLRLQIDSWLLLSWSGSHETECCCRSAERKIIIFQKWWQNLYFEIKTILWWMEEIEECFWAFSYKTVVKSLSSGVSLSSTALDYVV